MNLYDAIDGFMASRTALGRLSGREWENVWALRAFARVWTHCLETIWTGFGATGHPLRACLAATTAIYTRLAGVVDGFRALRTPFCCLFRYKFVTTCCVWTAPRVWTNGACTRGTGLLPAPWPFRVGAFARLS